MNSPVVKIPLQKNTKMKNFRIFRQRKCSSVGCRTLDAGTMALDTVVSEIWTVKETMSRNICILLKMKQQHKGILLSLETLIKTLTEQKHCVVQRLRVIGQNRH